MQNPRPDQPQSRSPYRHAVHPVAPDEVYDAPGPTRNDVMLRRVPDRRHPDDLALAVSRSLVLNVADGAAGICRTTQSARASASPRTPKPETPSPWSASRPQPSPVPVRSTASSDPVPQGRPITRPALSPPAGQTVQFRSWRCPTLPAHAAGQLSDSERGAVQRGWKLPWNQSVCSNRPIGGHFP